VERAEKALRAYNKAYLLYNPKVTDEDKERIGLPLYGGAKSLVNIPDSVPVLTVALKNPREILVITTTAFLARGTSPRTFTE
jgi:hypothetical protein